MPTDSSVCLTKLCRYSMAIFLGELIPMIKTADLFSIWLKLAVNASNRLLNTTSNNIAKYQY